MISERTKKALFILGFIAVVIGIAIALYLLFFRRPSPEKEAVTEEELLALLESGTLPTALEGTQTTQTGSDKEENLPQADEVAHGGVTQTTTLTLSPVQAAELQGNNMNYYDENDGRFYTIDADGNVRRLSETSFPKAESVAWNNTADTIVVEFPDGSNIVYDFQTGKQVTLPKHWEDFSFSTSGSNEIIAKSIGDDPGNRALIVSNEDGSNVRAVQALGDNAEKVTISPAPHDQVIAFSDTANQNNGFGRGLIIPVGKKQENFKGLIVEGFGFDSIWSPRGDYIVYSTVNTETNLPELWSVSGSTSSLGENRRRLSLNTWIDKCTFSVQTELYCAVPTELPAQA